MGSETEVRKLNRFTTLPVLLDYLERKKLVLVDPNNWDDRNDTLIIEAYKRRTRVKRIYALCFTYGNETIHHWKAFANGISGCCIEFSGSRLIEIFNKTKNLQHGIVQYKRIRDTGPSVRPEEIPFIKRHPYQPEKEYRVIWKGNADGDYFELDIPLEVIRRITFSQQMPHSVFESVRELLVRNFEGLKGKIFRSTVYENRTWIRNLSEEG